MDKEFDEFGREICDPEPVAVPAALSAVETSDARIRRIMREEFRLARMAAGDEEVESFEEADDFVVGDDDDELLELSSPYMLDDDDVGPIVAPGPGEPAAGDPPVSVPPPAVPPPSPPDGEA